MLKQFIRKLGRVYRTQMRHIYHTLWKRIQPDDFFKHPKLVMSLWYGSREGHLPNFNHPVTSD